MERKVRIIETQQWRRKHYNLYYIFLADHAEHPMPEEKRREVLKKIGAVYRKKVFEPPG